VIDFVPLAVLALPFFTTPDGAGVRNIPKLAGARDSGPSCWNAQWLSMRFKAGAGDVDGEARQRSTLERTSSFEVNPAAC